MADRFLTTNQVAELCGVHSTTVSRWIDAGHLPAQRTAGNHRRVRPNDLRAFMKERGFEVPAELGEPDLPVRVLVVDDDPALVRTFLRRLERKPRLFEAEGTTSGVEALISIGRRPPHVVVVDLLMPGLDGFELCRKIREDPELDDVRVVAISGRPADEVEQRCLEAGCYAFLQKPVELDELEEAIVEGRFGERAA